MPRILRTFSGIQPTGNIHLGNYLGAIKNWVLLQNNGLKSHIFEQNIPELKKVFGNDIQNYELANIFCIVNSHAITTINDPKELMQNTFELSAMLLACGLDPVKSTIFVQSEIDYHPALAWILDCQISMGEMSRMTQFKDKSAQNTNNINVGLFNYPALMASDILLYQTNLVPVGADQKQHLELTRNVAQKFNEKFGKCFEVPEVLITQNSAKIMGLDNPQIKMSKSIKSLGHAIFMLDTPEQIAKKIKKAQTDSLGVIDFRPNEKSKDVDRSGILNLLGIYKIFTKKTEEEIIKHFEGKGYGTLKAELSEVLINNLSPIREEYFKLLNDRSYVLSALESGKANAYKIAKQSYMRAKELIGLT